MIVANRTVKNAEKIASLDKVDAEDWFSVSNIQADISGEELGSFSVENDSYKILLSNQAKCPRCWKQKSTDEESLCERCAEVIQ